MLPFTADSSVAWQQPKADPEAVSSVDVDIHVRHVQLQPAFSQTPQYLAAAAQLRSSLLQYYQVCHCHPHGHSCCHTAKICPVYALQHACCACSAARSDTSTAPGAQAACNLSYFYIGHKPPAIFPISYVRLLFWQAPLQRNRLSGTSALDT